MQPVEENVRSYIAVRSEQGLSKLAWIREDSEGVYFVLCGAVQGAHWSYHTNGKFHFKKSRGEQEVYGHFRRPLGEITDHEHILFSSIPIPNAVSWAGSPLSKEVAAATASLFVDASSLPGTTVSIGCHLVNQDHVPKFASGWFARREGAFHFLAGAMFSLKNFAHLRVAVSLETVSRAA